jgi:hypothetical protein
MDVVSTINNSISLVARLRENSVNMSNVECKNILIELSNNLADVKQQIALKEIRPRSGN